MEESHRIVYEKLKEVARNRSVISYSEAGNLIGLDMATEIGRIRIAQILDDINNDEDQENSPMLSAVVIRNDINMPGSGFFECAKGLGKYHGGNDLVFWVHELVRVHNCWSKTRE